MTSDIRRGLLSTALWEVTSTAQEAFGCFRSGSSVQTVGVTIRFPVAAVSFVTAVLLAMACVSEATKHHNKGVELGDQGRWEEAIAEFDKAIELEGDPLSYMARGTSYEQLNDFDHALADLDKAIELDPGLGEAYNERGSVYALIDDTEKALADFQTALSLVDDDMARAQAKVMIESLGGELPEGELSPKRCAELATVNPGNIIVFEGDLTTEERIECGRLLSLLSR